MSATRNDCKITGLPSRNGLLSLCEDRNHPLGMMQNERVCVRSEEAIESTFLLPGRSTIVLHNHSYACALIVLIGGRGHERATL